MGHNTFWYNVDWRLYGNLGIIGGIKMLFNEHKDNTIAVNGFTKLINDHEYENGGIYCRVLNDGYFYGGFIANNKQAAIDTFFSGNYIKAW